MLRQLRRWWTNSSPQLLMDAQNKLLQTLCRSPFSITSTQNGMNSVAFVKSDIGSGSWSARKATGRKEPDTTVVLAHGFGSGLGFFFANVDPLLQSPCVKRVILVDWMGMGGSDRPQCGQRPLRSLLGENSWCDSRFSPSEAVRFFTDPFHQWFQETVASSVDRRNGDKVILVGHSLGGYLSTRYWLHHPDTPIDGLVLASPVGFPRKPPNVLRGRQLPTSLRVVDALWSSNVTPQQLVRMMGATRGRQNTRRILLGRIPQLGRSGGDSIENLPLKSIDDARRQTQQLQSDTLDLLADYLYHITVADPSGEFAMNSLLEPVASPDTMGVYAREPLADALMNVGIVSTRLRRIKVLYGDRDWMRLNEQNARNVLQSFGKRQRNIQCTVDVVPSSGHHLYLDNVADFTRYILED